MEKLIKLVLLIAYVVFAREAVASDNVQSLKMMFDKMVVKKNISLMSRYYDPQFKLYSNGKAMNYQEFYQGHEKIYKTPIQYKIKFDNDTVIENGDKIAARVFIITKMPGQKTTEIEVILIARYRKNKIYRLWELTYPNWTKLKSFKAFSG